MSRKIEDGKTSNQRYYEKHKAENARRVAEWMAAHPGANASACRAYYAANAEKERERARQNYRARKALGRTDSDRERDRMKAERRRAHWVGSPGVLTAAEWRAILAAYAHRCAYCGIDGPLEQDHVVPLSKGGTHTSDNVVPACKPCNSSKGNRRERPLRLSI